MSGFGESEEHVAPEPLIDSMSALLDVMAALATPYQAETMRTNGERVHRAAVRRPLDHFEVSDGIEAMTRVILQLVDAPSPSADHDEAIGVMLRRHAEWLNCVHLTLSRRHRGQA